VSEADACPSKQLRSELPAFEAAKSSLAATTAELVDVLPALATCSERGIAMHQRDHLGQPQVREENVRLSSGRHAKNVATMSDVPDEVGEQSGLDVTSAKLLLDAARDAIVSARSM